MVLHCIPRVKRRVTVSTRTVRLSVPVIYFRYPTGSTQTSPKIGAKTLLVSKKLFYSSRTYAVKWQFLLYFHPILQEIDSILNKESMLFIST
jgi:hypothetical protein